MAELHNTYSYNHRSPLAGEPESASVSAARSGGGEVAKSRAKSLRKNLTPAERKLWSYLRKKQIQGVKFRRQQPIDHYIADFVAFEKRLIIEVDGGQHSELKKSHDKKRDAYLKAQGFHTIRFWNNEVMENIEGVWTVIAAALEDLPPTLTLPRKGGGNSNAPANPSAPVNSSPIFKEKRI